MRGMSNKQAQALFGAASAGFSALGVALGAYAGSIGSGYVMLAAAITGAIGLALGAALTAYRSAQ